MTDLQRQNEAREGGEGSIPAAMRGSPGPVHEELWGMIEARVLELVQEYAPTFGEVRGMDGGRVQVHIDGEDDERTVGLPRRKGQRYERGERVKIQKSRSGEMFVDGTMSNRAGRDPAVGEEDLHDGAVDSRQLRQNSVTQNAIAGDSVDRNALRKDVTDFISAQGDKAEAARQLAQEANQNANGRAPDNHNHSNYASSNHNHNNYASNNHSHNNYASNNHTHGQGDITRLTEELNSIKARLSKLEKK